MAKMIDVKPSYKGEGKVWDSLCEYLSNDTVVYNQREINGREYDFCIMTENRGIIVIEVKGWAPDKITVNGVDNIEVEGYDKPQGSPKKQARAYRFSILNKISSMYNVSPLVLDMVCYPFISREQYYETKLNIISEEQYTLFKEDLEDKDILNIKIQEVYNINNVIPHSDFSYDLMLRIRRNLEAGLKAVNEENKVLPYSRLLVYPVTISKIEIDSLIDEYFLGVKNIIFVNTQTYYEEILSSLNCALKQRNIDYKKNNLHIGFDKGIPLSHDKDCFKIFNFELYWVKSLESKCYEKICINEGNVSLAFHKTLEVLAKCSSFNLQQYKVEHATMEKDILVEAGAGTGKTFLMVSRIAYLCNNESNPISDISKEIAMVTFTNDAAINMKKRLKQMFINYFVLTGHERFLKHVEDIDRANISTIHKFGIRIMRGESLYTGLGTNFRISSNEYDRGRSYDIFLGEYLDERERENSNFINEFPIPIYDLKKKLMNVADRLFDRSINFEQIKVQEMGVTVENNIPYFNDLLIRVVFPAEAIYLEMMKASNKVDLKECLIELNKILSMRCDKLENLKLRYMFIDEFQDTDDVQIGVFQKLQKSINTECKLFVVGDLKQSIYRFRGAKLNAFQRLQNGKENEWSHYRLNRNYRTDARLLKLFDRIFSLMGSRQILPYTREDDQLVSDVVTDAKEDELMICMPCHGKDSEKILELLNDIILSEKAKIENLMQTKTLSKEERTIAILVRSNWQVESVVNAATKRDINIEISTGGDLFQLPSTLDLYKIVLAISHNTSPVYLVNFIESNYTNLKLDYTKMHCISEEEKLKLLTGVLDEFFERRMGMSWNSVLSEVYSQPILYVLKKIFDTLQPWENYSLVPDKQRMYIANYEYLLERMIKFSRIDALTLSQVIEYLGINILTGQQQLSRSTEVDDDGVHVICTTVHKSKGLEYGTVILPYTYEDISDTKKVKLEANYDDNKLSYTVLFENGIRERNSNYSESTEVDEQIAEESRILYVALTRAIRSCIWINNLDSTPHISWASLLEE
ncbi:ATP-dependent helicase [Sedimentibacter hydroxybenzoicus DSM 7310]|uniref:DNA 3'-5' helicase n=1 Tax=Sedimentibacter hydroxybenzoicus DSM 7310 TaxID=1123245 RepID=A0A974BLL7_SEDHY|nr:ATP-dependent helicase [Sedimentibacter hydroxybenzoicus]NYB74957.1 ATP-dependent helicase [Sedimentibacter hydroxybenzoicus DSM 7310]